MGVGVWGSFILRRWPKAVIIAPARCCRHPRPGSANPTLKSSTLVPSPLHSGQKPRSTEARKHPEALTDFQSSHEDRLSRGMDFGSNPVKWARSPKPWLGAFASHISEPSSYLRDREAAVLRLPKFCLDACGCRAFDVSQHLSFHLVLPHVHRGPGV